MGEPIAEVGYLAGICAHDGTDWQKLKIDSEGRLEVVVTAGHEYVDRGDPSGYDFDIGDLICDGAWRDLDLSGVITDSDAVLVLMRVDIGSAVSGTAFHFKKNGLTYTVNSQGLRVISTTFGASITVQVALDENLIVEYNGAAALDAVNIAVRGWWRPAA